MSAPGWGREMGLSLSSWVFHLPPSAAASVCTRLATVNKDAQHSSRDCSGPRSRVQAEIQI